MPKQCHRLRLPYSVFKDLVVKKFLSEDRVVSLRLYMAYTKIHINDPRNVVVKSSGQVLIALFKSKYRRDNNVTMIEAINDRKNAFFKVPLTVLAGATINALILDEFVDDSSPGLAAE